MASHLPKVTDVVSLGVWLQNSALRPSGAQISDLHMVMSYAEGVEWGKGQP